MTEPEPTLPPDDLTIADLRADLEDFKSAIVARLEDIDAKLYELIYNQRKAGDRARAVAMLRAALAAAEAPEESGAE